MYYFNRKINYQWQFCIYDSTNKCLIPRRWCSRNVDTKQKWNGYYMGVGRNFSLGMCKRYDVLQYTFFYGALCQSTVNSMVVCCPVSIERNMFLEKTYFAVDLPPRITSTSGYLFLHFTTFDVFVHSRTFHFLYSM